MRRHTYISEIEPTEEQLLISSVKAWISYAENTQKRNAKSSPNVVWKCFACGKKIRVNYRNTRLRFLYCDKCRPAFVKKNGILLRYYMMFQNHVRAILLKNTNIERIIK